MAKIKQKREAARILKGVEIGLIKSVEDNERALLK